jgi:hypothetical protein
MLVAPGCPALQAGDANATFLAHIRGSGQIKRCICITDGVIRNMAGRTNLYRHFDKAGRLLYAGVSLSAFDRFLQHGKRTVTVARMDIETFATRREALQAERRAVMQEKPLYNIQHARAVPRPAGGSSMLSVRIPNRLLNALDELQAEKPFNSRTDALVTLLSEGLRNHDIIDDET